MSVNTCGKKAAFFRSLPGQSSGLMLWLSVVMHSAIALFPLRKAPELPEQAVLEPPSAITVTRLPEQSPAVESAESQPILLQPAAPQPATSQPVLQPIAPVEPDPTPSQMTLERPIDRPVETVPAETVPAETVPIENTPVENAPVENTPAETVPAENEGSTQPSPLLTEGDVAAMAAVWEGFLVGLQSGLSEFSLQEILSFFGQPGQEDLFFDDNQQPTVSVVSYHLLEDKTPEQVFEEVVNPELNAQQGFDVQVYGDFAGGPVYEVMQGEIVHYLNIVPLNERSGSVLIVGDRPPGV
ncbi:MAG: hypothetical protein AAFV90_29400 [Cyanobacteria bacterium J06634_5]